MNPVAATEQRAAGGARLEQSVPNWGDTGWLTRRPNKELKLTKPSIMELRSLTPVFCGLYRGAMMGKHIERVPPDFVHPTGRSGEPRPGAHKPILRKLRNDACTAYQVYENTTEGTPISPVLPTESELRGWLLAQGHSPAAVENFMIVGVASSLFFKDGQHVDGIEALALLSREAALEMRAKYRTSVRRPG